MVGIHARTPSFTSLDETNGSDFEQGSTRSKAAAEA